MESETQVQILDKSVFISLHANALGKSMNPSVVCQLWINNQYVAKHLQIKESRLLHVLYSHDHYIYTYTCRNIFNTIRTSEDTSLEKYTSHFI